MSPQWTINSTPRPAMMSRAFCTETVRSCVSLMTAICMLQVPNADTVDIPEPRATCRAAAYRLPELRRFSHRELGLRRFRRESYKLAGHHNLQGGSGMCGIVGYIGAREAEPILVDGLRRLEYRGYDSAG